MGIRTIKIVECDLCKENIDTHQPWIDAQTYGIVMHTECFRKQTAFSICNLLGLDDIQVVISDTDRRKMIYSAPSYLGLENPL